MIFLSTFTCPPPPPVSERCQNCVRKCIREEYPCLAPFFPHSLSPYLSRLWPAGRFCLPFEWGRERDSVPFGSFFENRGRGRTKKNAHTQSAGVIRSHRKRFSDEIYLLSPSPRCRASSRRSIGMGGVEP